MFGGKSPPGKLILNYVTAGSQCQTHTHTLNTADRCLNAAPHNKGCMHALPIVRMNMGTKTLNKLDTADRCLNVASPDKGQQAHHALPIKHMQE